MQSLEKKNEKFTVYDISGTEIYILKYNPVSITSFGVQYLFFSFFLP